MDQGTMSTTDGRRRRWALLAALAVAVAVSVAVLAVLVGTRDRSGPPAEPRDPASSTPTSTRPSMTILPAPTAPDDVQQDGGPTTVTPTEPPATDIGGTG